MGTEIDYLYGDSTPSPLKINFIGLLCDVFDFAVDVLLHDVTVGAAMQDVERLSEVTEREIAMAEGLAAEVTRTLECASPADGDSIAARCAAKIRRGVQDLTRSEADAARAAVAMEKARWAQVAASAQSACARAFETLALRQVLPDAVVATKLWIEGASHYVVRLHGQTPYGLKWIIGVEVPPSHALANVLRIKRIAEHLEIEAPEATGLFHKEIKLRPQRFDRLCLTELAIDPTGTTIKLRAAPDATSGGFDVSFSDDSACVKLCRVLPGGAAPDAPDAVSDEDAAKLQWLRRSLVAMVEEVAGHKRSLVAASLDEAPLHELETPRVLVERIIASTAPTVEQISKRSPVAGELALKRVVNESRREEVFVSKSDLLKKLEPLPFAERRLFDAFNLWEVANVPPSPGAQASLERGRGQAPTRATSEGAQPSAKSTAAPRPLLLEDVATETLPGPGRLSAGALRIRNDKADGDGSAGSTGKWPALHQPSTPRAGV